STASIRRRRTATATWPSAAYTLPGRAVTVGASCNRRSTSPSGYPRYSRYRAEQEHERSRGEPYPSAATGADSPLLYIPDRSKQHARRLPEASISQVVAMRRARVSGFFAEVIQKIQSRRADGVRLCHGARAW